MIEIRTSNGGRGYGWLIDCDGTHLGFVARDRDRKLWVPVALVTSITPVCT